MKHMITTEEETTDSEEQIEDLKGKEGKGNF